MKDRGRTTHKTFVGPTSWAALGSINDPEKGRKKVGDSSFLPSRTEQKKQWLKEVLQQNWEVRRQGALNLFIWGHGVTERVLGVALGQPEAGKVRNVRFEGASEVAETGCQKN